MARVHGNVALAMVVATCLAVAATVSLGAPAFGHGRDGSSGDAASVAEPLSVVILGDSYSAGVGARGSDGEPRYYGPDLCQRSTAAWGEQYADTLADLGYAVSLLNRACAAARLGSLTAPTPLRDMRVLAYPEPEQPYAPHPDAFYEDWARADAACIAPEGAGVEMVAAVERRARADGAWDVSVVCQMWSRPQVEALNPDVDLVLMTMGGNDAGFPEIVRGCLLITDPERCAAAMAGARDYVESEYADALFDALATIHEHTDGQAVTVLVGYPGLEVDPHFSAVAWDGDRPVTVEVGEPLRELTALGLDAQREAVARAQSEFGVDSVVHVDEVAEVFAGHEPSARAYAHNGDRWLMEAFDGHDMDEWYHPNARGHEAIARTVAAYGAFGAQPDHEPARDVALLVAPDGAALDAAREAVAGAAAWAGARVSVVQERVVDGVVERRIVVSDVVAAEAAADWSADDDLWVPAGELQLRGRWNATQHVIAVGDVVSDAGSLFAPQWGSSRPATVWMAPGPDPLASIRSAADGVAGAPHAWAGGAYVAPGDATVTLDASGSFAAGPADVSWDLDGDGVFERQATGGVLEVASADLSAGWVSMRVDSASGSAVTQAWVGEPWQMPHQVVPCVGDGGSGSVRSATGRVGCRPLAEPGGDPITSATDADADSVNDLGGGLVTTPPLPPGSVAMDERVLGTRGPRTTGTSRAGAQGRGRPREIMRRELELVAMLRGTVDA